MVACLSETFPECQHASVMSIGEYKLKPAFYFLFKLAFTMKSFFFPLSLVCVKCLTNVFTYKGELC